MSCFSKTRRSVRVCTAACVAAVLLNAAAAEAAVIAGPVVDPANGHSYYLLSQNVWTASESEAVTLGGHLATIDNAAENTFVYSTFGQFGGVNRNLWIGLYDADQAVNSPSRATRRTEFAWISGTPVSYTDWSPAEPNNPTSGDPATPEFYGHIWNPTDPFAGTWNNYRDLSTEFSVGNFGVAEVVPEPSAMAAWGIVLAGLLVRRRA